MSTISLILTFIAISALLVTVIIFLSKENNKLKKENRDLSNDYKVVYNALRKAEEKKSELNTGDDAIDVEHCIDVLQDLARRVY